MFINKHIHPRIREWFYTQMIYWLRYVLNTTDCDDAVVQSFDAILEKMYRYYVYNNNIDGDDVFYPKFTPPAYNCLWDVLFNHLGDIIYDYTLILSAYRVKYKFTTKDQIYHHMISELDAWIDTINNRNDIITIALGMTLNINIFDVFYNYNAHRNANTKYMQFYDNILNELDKINFNATNLSIDYWYYIEEMRFSYDVKPYTPHVQQVGDLQSVYSSHITASCRYLIHTMEYYPNKDSYNVVLKPITIQDCIQLFTDYIFEFSSPYKIQGYLQQYGYLNDITDKWQILDHISNAIGSYPKTLELALELCRTHRFKFYFMHYAYFPNFSSMTELINFDTIPISLISPKLTREPIPEYCAKLSKTYRRIKAAKHEDSY